jgi:hypothetical protein
MGKKYSEKADVYSAGVIMWEIASRKRFFSEIAFLSQVEDRVIAGERPDIPQVRQPSHTSLASLSLSLSTMMNSHDTTNDTTHRSAWTRCPSLRM